MEADWIGKAVSIVCDEKLGVFQGIIKDISASHITIIRAFRNGVPLRKQDAEVTLRSNDILDISRIASYNGQNTVMPTIINKPAAVKQPNFINGHAVSPVNTTNAAGAVLLHTPNGIKQPPPPLLPHWQSNGVNDLESGLSHSMQNINVHDQNGYRSTPTSSRAASAQQLQHHSSSNKSSPPTISGNNSVAQFFGNMIPSKVEVRLGQAFTSSSSAFASTASIDNNRPHSYYGQQTSLNENTSQIANGGKNTNGGATKKQRNKVKRENSMRQQQSQTFATSANDPELHEDFDFEGNLALFNKKKIWDTIESDQKPDVVRQTVQNNKTQQAKYRHDENILVSEPTQFRQIICNFNHSQEFVTDEGLVIPAIPPFIRWKIEALADKNGLTIQRQTDALVRGATDLAIQLLGGARRLLPENAHQWPKIVIFCEDVEERAINMAASTGRLLASHGLRVSLYLSKKAKINDDHAEVSLYKATGNKIFYAVRELFTPDLVILISNFSLLSPESLKWLKENRASLLAIDPPPSGIVDVDIKYSILPILPLNGISSSNYGKLYLCNLGIPEKIYNSADIKYKSPYGHKYVIPIHAKN